MFTFLGVFGNISNPLLQVAPGVTSYNDANGGGIIVLFTSLYRLSIVIAGLYTLINIVLAGYGYLSAAGDPKLLQKSNERIWRSVLGLIIVAGSLLLAGIIGFFLFGANNWTLLISPKIYTP